MKTLLRLTLVLCIGAISVARAQSLSGYSGYIRQEDTHSYEANYHQDLGNGGFQKSGLVQTESRVVEFRIQDGQATGSLQVKETSDGKTHQYFVGKCLDGRVDSATTLGREREDTTGTHSGPAICEANFDDEFADVGCYTDAVYTLTTTETNSGSRKSGCPEVPNFNDSFTDERTNEIDGYNVGFLMDYPAGKIPEVLSGSVTEDLTTGGKRTVSWYIAREGQYELILQPEANYPNWRPKAGPSERVRGNALILKATLRRKDGKPLDMYAKEISFRFSQRSREPGTTINFPSVAHRASPTPPDLMFEEDLNAPLDLEVRGEDGAEAVTQQGNYEEVYVYVSAFDWGAYGAITAEAVLRTGERVAGKLEDGSGHELLVPKRASVDDPIAEVWRKNGALRGGDALSDLDAIPQGDNHNGDGLSLYEEYRGFHVNGSRVEGDPTQKELFIRNKVGGWALAGIATFSQRSGLKVHSELMSAEIGEARDINFNSTGRFQRVRQHGVILEMVTEERGYAIAAGGPGTPGQVTAVEFPLDLFILKFPPGFADATIAHELGHAVNIHHHGETDPGDKRWRVVDGQVYESNAGDFSLNATNKTPVTLLDENGTPLPLTFVDVNRPASIGVRQGQHSGDESCAMRYDAARFHIRDDPSVRYYNSSREVVGTRFCSGTAGTGVNLQSRVPAPRYGDAAQNRGACTTQICVNDAHVHPER